MCEGFTKENSLEEYRNIIIQENRDGLSMDGWRKMANADLVLRRIDEENFEAVKDRYNVSNRTIRLTYTEQAKILLTNLPIGV